MFYDIIYFILNFELFVIKIKLKIENISIFVPIATNSRHILIIFLKIWLIQFFSHFLRI